MTGWVTAALKLAGSLFVYLTGRQKLAQDPVMKQNKIAQREQDEADRIERLTRIAMKDPDPSKRKAAAAELRKLDSE